MRPCPAGRHVIRFALGKSHAPQDLARGFPHVGPVAEIKAGHVLHACTVPIGEQSRHVFSKSGVSNHPSHLFLL